MPNKHDPVFTKLETTDLPGDTLDSELTDFELHVDQRPDFLEVTTRYIIGSVLGQGGGGIVYRAHDELLGRGVAVKILRDKFLNRREIVERFEQEARIIGYLQHPGIPPVYECGVSDEGRPFHSMKLVIGCTLREMINDRAPDICIESLNAFAPVCQTMAYGHCEGVVHQDLKPENVMVGPFGEVHIMDWGHARHLFPGNVTNSARTEEVGWTREKLHVGGTLSYMSPEQARNQATTKQFDVFSLGATLCHLLTGSPPYTGNTRNEILKQAENAELDEAMRRLDRCRFDSQVVRLAKQCMSLDPKKRPADAVAVANEISSYRQNALQLHKSDMDRFFELSLDLFCIAGFDGYFRRINANFARALGISNEQLLAHPFIDLVHEEDKQETLKNMSVLIEGKPVVKFRNRYRTAAGCYVQFEWSAKSIPEEKLIFAVARITEDKD